MHFSSFNPAFLQKIVGNNLNLLESLCTISRYALQDRLQHQFPGFQIMENTHLRLLWLCPYICEMGKKFNGQERVFPNTAPLLDRHPPFHTHPSITSLIMKIKKGSKYYFKSLNRASDFFTVDHLEGWKRLMDKPSMTKDDLRCAYKMAQSKVFSGQTYTFLVQFCTFFHNQFMPDLAPKICHMSHQSLG